MHSRKNMMSHVYVRCRDIGRWNLEIESRSLVDGVVRI